MAWNAGTWFGIIILCILVVVAILLFVRHIRKKDLLEKAAVEEERMTEAPGVDERMTEALVVDERMTEEEGAPPQAAQRLPVGVSVDDTDDFLTFVGGNIQRADVVFGDQKKITLEDTDLRNIGIPGGSLSLEESYAVNDKMYDAAVSAEEASRVSNNAATAAAQVAANAEQLLEAYALYAQTDQVVANAEQYARDDQETTEALEGTVADLGMDLY